MFSHKTSFHHIVTYIRKSISQTSLILQFGNGNCVKNHSFTNSYLFVLKCRASKTCKTNCTYNYNETKYFIYHCYIIWFLRLKFSSQQNNGQKFAQLEQTNCLLQNLTKMIKDDYFK